MNTEEKSVHWQRHFTNWQQSGLSQRDYCKQHDLTFSTFGYWRKRLKSGDPTSLKLIPVSVSRPVLINVYLPSGVRIEAPLHSLAELLPLLASEVSR